MDARQFLGKLTGSAHLLARVPHMLCAKHEVVDGMASVTFAFTDEPTTHVERFASVEQCAIWWNEFTTLMREHCEPPCLLIKNVLFQPIRLRRFVCHTNEHMHFVILDFVNGRTLGLGSRKKEEQIALYVHLAEILEPYLEPLKPSPFSKFFIPPK